MKIHTFKKPEDWFWKNLNDLQLPIFASSYLPLDIGDYIQVHETRGVIVRKITRDVFEKWAKKACGERYNPAWMGEDKRYFYEVVMD